MNPIFEGRLAYGYVRVSTYKQAVRGLSADAQIQSIENYCIARRYRLVETKPELGISGGEKKRIKRKILTTLLESLPPGSCLIVTDISRLARSLRNFMETTQQLDQKGCALISITQQLDTGTAYGRFTANLIALLNQLEIDITDDRTKRIREYKEENGEFPGKIPYGWKLENGPKSPVIEVPEEQAVIKLIFEFASERNPDGKRKYGDYKIATKLTNMFIRPPGKSKAWHGSAVNRILNRKNGPAAQKVYVNPDPMHISNVVGYVPPRDRNLPIMPHEEAKQHFVYQDFSEFETNFLQGFRDNLSDDEADENQ
jgi:site-specific DNA recombinase